MPSAIEWTDETWNPVTGCTKVSPGCDSCYMFALYPRLRAMGVAGYNLTPGEVQLLPQRLELPYSWRRPRVVFVNSMSDLFHGKVPFDFVTEVFRVMAQAGAERGHIFQVLTKRPGRAAFWWQRYGAAEFGEWPEMVWLGTSVESQKYAPRVKVLARVPATVRFVSAEPLLEDLDLTEYLLRGEVDWVIAGGESGRRARPMDLDWARSLRDQCQEAGVSFFLKQLGGAKGKRSGDAAELDGRLWRGMPEALAVAVE